MMFIAIISLMLAGCGSNSSSSSSDGDANGGTESTEKIKLKFATYFPGTSPIYTDFTEPWMNRVTELTNGQVEFDYYPSEQLGKAGDLLTLTGDGVTDLSIFPANYYADTMPYSQMMASLPNLSENTDQGTKAFNDLLKENTTLVETDYLKNGVRPLVAQVSPNYELWTTGKELRVPSDLKGLKIKTPGGIANKMYEYLGAVPVTIAHAEVYEALDRKVIDVASYYSMAVKNSGTDELLRYAVFPHIGAVVQGININEKVWQSLPENVQQAMVQAGDEVIERIGQVYEEEDKKFNEEFVANGGTIAELTEEELQEWRTVTEEFTAKWLEENAEGPYKYNEVLEAYKEKLAEYK